MPAEALGAVIGSPVNSAGGRVCLIEMRCVRF